MITPPIGHHRSTVPPPRSGAARGHRPEAERDAGDEPTLDEALKAHVERTVAEALARVSTDGDAEVAAQKAAFDRYLAGQAEALRESNAIREMMAKQREHENEFLKEYIRSI